MKPSLGYIYPKGLVLTTNTSRCWIDIHTIPYRAFEARKKIKITGGLISATLIAVGMLLGQAEPE